MGNTDECARPCVCGEENLDREVAVEKEDENKRAEDSSNNKKMEVFPLHPKPPSIHSLSLMKFKQFVSSLLPRSMPVSSLHPLFLIPKVIFPPLFFFVCFSYSHFYNHSKIIFFLFLFSVL